MMTGLAILMLGKVTVVLAVGLAASRLASRSRAAVRHLLLAATFIVAMALPLASMWTPTIGIPVPVRGQSNVLSEVGSLLLENPATASDVIAPVSSAAANPSSLRRSTSVSWPWVTIVWLVGAAVSLLPLVVGLLQVRSLRRSGLGWPEGQAIADGLAVDAGISRHVEVLRHEGTPSPLTFGLIRPIILLPLSVTTWRDADVRRAIVHEVEHIRRGDWLSQCLVRAACAVYWCHPLVWIVRRRFVLEAERACDDAVLRRSEATAYADQLVALAGQLSAGARQPLLAMANRADLSTRVLAVLNQHQARGRAGRVWTIAAIAAAMVVLVAVSPLRIVAATEAQPARHGQTSSASPQEKFDVVSVKPCADVSTAQTGRGAGPNLAQTSPGHVFWACVTLASLVDQAYAGLDFPLLNRADDPIAFEGLPGERPDPRKRVRGGPAWMYSERFTIEATAPVDVINPPKGGVNLMRLPAPMNAALRAMLVDRFQLKLRRETEELPMYGLTVATSGLKAKPRAPGDCDVPPSVRPPGTQGRPTFDGFFEGNWFCGTFWTAPLGMQARIWAGETRETVRATTDLDRRYEYRGVSMQAVANHLAHAMDRWVLDKTGLTGEFLLAVEFKGDESTAAGGGVFLVASRPDYGGTRRPETPTGTGSTIFKAFESIGLKIEPTKGPAEYLAIDRVEKPSPNLPAVEAQARATGSKANR